MSKPLGEQNYEQFTDRYAAFHADYTPGSMIGLLHAALTSPNRQVFVALFTHPFFETRYSQNYFEVEPIEIFFK